jgi:uncharacterized delta-60 repeat protein
MKKFYLLFCLSILVQLAQAQVGSLDPSFGNGGIEKIRYFAKGPLIALNGDSYGLDIRSSESFPSIRVFKYTADGNPDVSYGTNGFTETIFLKYVSAAVQDDGKVIVLGSTRPSFGPVQDQTKVVRFNIDGTLDDTFGVNGESTSPTFGGLFRFPTKLLRQSGDFIVFGYATFVSGLNADFIYNISSSNNLEVETYISEERNALPASPAFDPASFSLSKTIAFQGDKLIVAGLEQVVNEAFPNTPTTGYFLTKYIGSQRDSSFGLNGRLPATLPPCSYGNMLLTSDEKLLVVNAVFNPGTGNQDFRILRYNKDGSPDLGFSGDGIATTDFGNDDSAYSIILQGDKIIVGGSTLNKLTGRKQFAIARFNNDGTLDNSFSEDGKQTLSEPDKSYHLEQMKISENRLLVYGNIISDDGSTDRVIAAYLLNGNVALTCPQDKTLPTDKGLCSAVVTDITAVITPSGSNATVDYTFSGATTKTGTGNANGSAFNKGETLVTYKLSGQPTTTCSFKINVLDKEAPVITKVSASPWLIWPPNHKKVPVEVRYDVKDNCGNVTTRLSVSSNEPESGTDKDDVAGDWEVIDAHHLTLRAERSSKGNGRTYTILITATDAAGNKSEQSTKVEVPRDNSKVKEAIIELLVKLFSNPTRDFFTLFIQSNSNESITLRVMDIFGRVVEVKSNVAANSTLKIGSNYRAGVYFAELKQGNKKQVMTLIKY